MSKYHSRKTEVDGIVFDSKAESTRYIELRIMERAGRISDLELQPTYELIPKHVRNGKTIRKTVYRADFRYYDNELGKTIIEDVKGFETKEYKLKKKLFEYLNPDLEIVEIK